VPDIPGNKKNCTQRSKQVIGPPCKRPVRRFNPAVGKAKTRSRGGAYFTRTGGNKPPRGRVPCFRARRTQTTLEFLEDLR